VDFPAEHTTPHLRRRFTGVRVGADEVVRLTFVSALGERHGGSVGDVTDVDTRDAGVAQRLRVNAVLEDGVLEPVVVLVEVVRPQNGVRDA
jgi:hypothetical protein